MQQSIQFDQSIQQKHVHFASRSSKTPSKQKIRHNLYAFQKHHNQSLRNSSKNRRKSSKPKNKKQNRKQEFLIHLTSNSRSVTPFTETKSTESNFHALQTDQQTVTLDSPTKHHITSNTNSDNTHAKQNKQQHAPIPFPIMQFIPG